MTAAVIAQRRAHGFVGHSADAGKNFFERFALQLGRFFQRGIEPGDIGGVMLAVMNLHRAGIDVRLKRVECVGQGRQRKGSGRLRHRARRKHHRTCGKSTKFDKLTTVAAGMGRFHGEPLTANGKKSNQVRKKIRLIAHANTRAATSRRPSSVRSASTAWISGRPFAINSASPPVAMIFGSPTSSARIFAMISRTRPR